MPGSSPGMTTLDHLICVLPTKSLLSLARECVGAVEVARRKVQRHDPRRPGFAREFACLPSGQVEAFAGERRIRVEKRAFDEERVGAFRQREDGFGVRRR